MNSDYQFFTVVGVGRSGTSLLMTMLDSHPQLALPPETQFLSRHVIKYPCATLGETEARLRQEVNYQRLGIPLSEFLSPFHKGDSEFDNARAYRRIFELWAERTGLGCIGDKSPKNIEYLPVIKALYPAAKVIHIVRDPRDVFLSRTKAGWCSGRHRVLQTLAYRAQFDQARFFGPKLFNKNYLEIHYEALLSNPGETLAKVCELLNVSFEKSMLDHRASAETHVFPEEIDWKRQVLGPLLQDNKEKWKRELSAEQIAYIEDCCTTSFATDMYQHHNEGGGQKGFAGKFTQIQIDVLSRAYRSWLNLKNQRVLNTFAKNFRSHETITARHAEANRAA
jgi:hypothetical protein